MTEVAEVAKVSVMSVSRAIRDPESVSPEIRQRVQEAMRQTGYVPNAIAGSLASQRTRVIAVIVPFINASFADTIRGVTDVLSAQGYQILIGHTAFSLETEETLIEAFLSRRVDGMLLTGREHTVAARRRLRSAAIPVVETWNLTDDPIDAVCGFSNYHAARAMTSYLIRRGCRRIGYLGGITPDNDRAADRERGFLDEIEASGLASEESMRSYRPLEFHEGRHGCEELLERHPDLDGIFAASDMLAVGAVFTCIKRGIQVPGQIAIAGFDDADIASAMHPALTTVRVPRYEMGKQAARVLLQRLSQQGTTVASPRIIDLGYDIVVRQSA